MDTKISYDNTVLTKVMAEIWKHSNIANKWDTQYEQTDWKQANTLFGDKTESVVTNNPWLQE